MTALGIETTLIELVATPVARFLLFRFLGAVSTGEAAAEGGGELFPIVSRFIQGRREQGLATRQFQDLAERMVQHLVPLFIHAERQNAVNTEAVAHELGTTLAGRVTAEFVVARELDPAKLSRAFKEARPLPGGQLSSAETELYDRALEQSVRYIVEVASLLPRFESASVAAQVQRLSRIGDVVDKTLAAIERVETMVATNLDQGGKYTRYEGDYRQATGRNTDRLELFGVDVDVQSRRYQLSVAYVSLSLEDGSANDGEARLKMAEAMFGDLRNGGGRLLIRGDAGSGKSTLFRWAAWTAALSAGEERDDVGDAVAEPYCPWRSCVPFLIRLRDCKNGRLPPVDDFPLQTAWELSKPPSGWVRRVLEEGRALIFIDGVDEVPGQYRTKIYEDIKQLVGTYGNCLYLLSTRPSAVPADWLKPLGFREATINPLSPTDREHLIDRWHEAVARELEQVGRSGAELPDLAQKLKVKLRETAAIARVATNPLLAAVICALHRERNQKLPETQAELCEALCQMLLHRRENESLETSGFPAAYRELTYPQKKHLVRELAHDMVLNGRSVLDKDDAAKKIGRMLGLLGKPEENALTVLEALVERSGVLRETRPGEIDFIHNTFKEYLAADVFAERKDDGLLVRNALDPSWEQVLIFAVARGEQSFNEKLINGVLAQANAVAATTSAKSEKLLSPGQERQYAIMAVRLQSSAILLGKELREQVLKVQSKLFPPSTMAEAAALAMAGDVVLPFLRYHPWDGVRKVAASIRALALVGSSAANEVLKGYLLDKRWTVIDELVQIFNPLEIPHVRAYLKSGNSLPPNIAARVTELGPVSDMKTVETLVLDRTSIKDLGPLVELVNLKTLSCSSTRVKNLSPVSALKRLKKLMVNYVEISDLGPVSVLEELESLSLVGTQVEDVSPLRALKKLDTLNLSRTKVEDLSPLADLAALKVLILESAHVKDLSPLSRLSKIKMLALGRTGVRDLQSLAASSGLIETLMLDGTEVDDFGLLSSMANLKVLSLRKTRVREVAFLSSMASLEVLDLSQTQVTDLSPLRAITTLKTLVLSGTQVSSLEPLSSMKALNVLAISRTPVKDLRPVSGLVGLRSLDMSETEVKELEPLYALPELKHVGLFRVPAVWSGPEHVHILKNAHYPEFSSYSHLRAAGSVVFLSRP